MFCFSDLSNSCSTFGLNANATDLAFTNFGTAFCLRCNFALIPLTQPISSLKTSSRRANMPFRVISHLDSSLAMVNDFIIFQSSWILFNHSLPNKAGPPRLTTYKLRYEHWSLYCTWTRITPKECNFSPEYVLSTNNDSRAFLLWNISHNPPLKLRKHY